MHLTKQVNPVPQDLFRAEMKLLLYHQAVLAMLVQQQIYD
jgi:hypothetical protein